MRAAKSDQKEHVTVLAAGEPAERRLPPVSPNDAAVVADATANNDPDREASVPPPKYYRVVKGGMVLENGFRTRMTEGKELDSLNYDIRRLQQQGIRVEEIQAADRSGAPLSSFG